MTQAYNLSQFANFLNTSGQVSAAGIQSGVTLESGTVSLYYQASAPTGWTQVTSLNDYALRIVSGVGGTTGGTTAFSTVFTNQTPTITGGTVGATTLTTSQIPSHAHNIQVADAGGISSTWIMASGGPACGSGNVLTGYEGGGGSHTHSIASISSSAITLNVRYANIILCSKN